MTMRWQWRLVGQCIVLLTVLPSEAGISRPRAITQCAQDGTTFSLYDAPRTTSIGTFDSIRISGQMLWLDKPGAVFSFSNSGHVIFQKRIDEMENPNGWIGVSNDRRSFAFNTSTAGASGGWFVTILRVDETGHILDLTKALKSVEADFSARHFCKTRGNNYEAIKWQKNDQLLISASVYGTSDCGADMGHTEGYVLDVVTGKILSHMTATQMLELPYVCTYNVWQPGDPEP